MTKLLSIEQLRERMNQGGYSDPLVYLQAIQDGQDINKVSGIYTLIMEIDALTGGDIDAEDWAEIVDYVTNFCKYKSVPRSESIAAAKTLAEYLHPKRKQIELTGDIAAGEGVAQPLDKDEVQLFLQTFEEEYG